VTDAPVPGRSDGSPAFAVHVRQWTALARAHVAVRGALEASSAAGVVDAVRSTLEPGIEIALDLSEVTALDDAGVDAILACRRLAERAGAELDVQDPSPVVRSRLASISRRREK
jgi:anti-anti-sigma regulatory factor